MSQTKKERTRNKDGTFRKKYGSANSRQRSLSGLVGVKPQAKSDVVSELLDIVVIAVGTVAGSKGAGMVSNMLGDKLGDGKIMQAVPGAVVAAVGIGGTAMVDDRIVRNACKGLSTWRYVESCRESDGQRKPACWTCR
jgi:hypothetical protein